MAEVKVYGADWCGMTTRTLRHLDDLKIPYKYIDIEADADAAQWVKDQNGGLEKKPTLDIEGVILTEPNNGEVDTVLREHKLLS